MFDVFISCNGIKEAWKHIGVQSVVCLILIININFIFINEGLRDYGSFIASGDLIQSSCNPYYPYHPYVYHVKFEEHNIDYYSPNLNPPILLPLFEFISRFDPFESCELWRFFSICLYMISIWLYVTNFKIKLDKNKICMLLCHAGFWHVIELGQIYMLLLILLVSALITIKNKYYLFSGLLIGLIASFKPNFLLWVMLIFCAGFYKIFFASISVFIFFSLIPIFLYGPEILRYWVEAVLKYPHISCVGNNSIFYFLDKMCLSNWLILTFAIFIVLYISWSVYDKNLELRYICDLGVAFSLMLSPVAWVGYTTLLIPFLLEEKWTRTSKFAVFILCIPFPFVLLTLSAGYFVRLIFGGLYGWALISIALYLVVKGLKNE